ncbi:heterokaryon incompatibility protein-domain-containing protein [Phaeosphaeria sp. MPI-PUGE-AT-0046c]|nr:heterokaryon incompatibility protein-domain-containing protein [Phaeosphaeria sp. MPI-PUGE-AT-0046c]
MTAELPADAFARFQYHALGPNGAGLSNTHPSNEIRLLNILPGNFEDRIHFSIIHKRIGSARGLFTALSYTWGNPLPAHLLIHHPTGSRLAVTGNCENALRRLRHLEKSTLVWVDAVCINQIDLEERQAQVSMMGEIYRQAGAVAVYLGNEAENSDLAMEFLASMSRLTWDDPIANIYVEALKALFRRPWFSRVWVLQEVHNAETVHLICGQHTVAWSQVQLFRWWHRLGRRDIHSWPLVTTIKDRSRYTSRDILHLLTQARQCGATDERDKIYALLPMLHDAASEGLVPDYTLSREEVFSNFATYIARHDPSFLCTVSHPVDPLQSSGLPTWVPQWDVDDGCMPLWPHTGRAMIESPEQNVLGSDLYHNPYKLHETRFYESGLSDKSQKPVILPPDDMFPGGVRLATRGLWVTRIAWIGNPLETSVEELRDNILKPYAAGSEFLKTWIWRRGYHNYRQHLDTEKDPSDPGYIYQGEYSQPSEHPLHYSIDAALAHAMWEAIEHDPAAPGRSYISELKAMHLRRERDQTYRHWREEVVGVINGRAIFDTVDEGMGLAPAAAQPGDIICILFGAPVPFVLRSVGGDCYAFIGSCYLNGMMSVNAIEKLRADESESKAKIRGVPATGLEQTFILI